MDSLDRFSSSQSQALVAALDAGLQATDVLHLLLLLSCCRQCSSGLQAIADVAAAIRAGFYTVSLLGVVNAHVELTYHMLLPGTSLNLQFLACSSRNATLTDASFQSLVVASPVSGQPADSITDLSLGISGWPGWWC
jgi:acetyl-CoA acetyltransferase